MQAKAPSLMQRHTVVPSWQGSPGYVDVVAKLVAEQLDSLDDVSEKTTVLFSAHGCLLYTSPSPRDKRQSRMPSSA